jgi:heat shock protein HtpX
MRRRRRHELFAPDRGLQARMLLTALGTPALVFGSVAAVVLFAPLKVLIGVGLAAVVGVGGTIRQRWNPPSPLEVTPAQQPELHAIVDRLCVLADLPKPDIVVEPEEQPNSWLVARWRGRARLHVTRGLLDLLTASELEAVIAHELAHLANRDAAVMTAVGGPGAALLGGGRRLMGGGWLLMFGGFVAMAIGWLSRLGTQALSRHRELAADAGSAALTGRPAALATALRRISGELRMVPEEDLRVAAYRDVFHLLPVGESATHPPLAKRIERLERLEQRMQAARLPAP